MGLVCCNKKMQIIQSIDLYNTDNQLHRILTIARCRNKNCGCLKAEIVYWDKLKECFNYIKIPKNKIHKVVEEYKRKPYLSSSAFQKIKTGCRENMNWKYQKDGSVYDLNGTNYGKAENYGK